MLFLLSLVVRVLARLLVLSATDEATKDLEIMVLQQQLRAYSAARLAAPGSPPSTASCSQRPAARFPDGGGGHCSWSPLRRCCVGTANSCDASGPTGRRADLAGHHSTPRSSRWCCGWQGRTRAGAACGSAGSCASSASGWAPRRFGCCCGDAGWARRRGAAGRAGRSSSGSGRGDRCVRLLHGGDDPAQDAVRVVLHPAQHQAGRRGRGHRQS